MKNDVERALLRGLRGARPGVLSSPYIIAIWREQIKVMEKQLRSPRQLLQYLQDTEAIDGELRWYRETFDIATGNIDPSEDYRRMEIYQRREHQFNAYAATLRKNAERVAGYKLRNDKGRLIESITVQNNPLMKDMVSLLASELERWPERHRLDKGFFGVKPEKAQDQILKFERPDIQVGLKIAKGLGGEVRSIVLPGKERPAYVDAIEFGIGFIPLVGNAVASYESWTGKDLFGYQLSEAERAILGASILFPVVGRCVKNGRAIYTANRMSRLYGDDAAKWSSTLAMGERLSADATGFRHLKEGDNFVRTKTKISTTLAEEIAATLKALDFTEATKLTAKAPDEALEAAFKRVVAKHPKLAGLDPYAFERLAKKARVADHVKGQMLEELMENRMVRMLRDPAGKRALGLEAVEGQLEFIPGHIIRDLDGYELTDGMIVRLDGDLVEVIAVFEAKAGKAASRGLGAKYTSRKKLPEDFVEEINAYAKDLFEELQEIARVNDKPVGTTIEKIAGKLKQGEAGQIERDIERLSDATIYIGSTPTQIKFSPTRTKFFGVLPDDISSMNIRKKMRKEGIKNFEVMGVGITQKELNAATQAVVKEGLGLGK